MERALGSRYLLAERLGGGGMGTVYRVRRRDGGPDRAVKLLRGEFAEDPVVLARFVQEHALMLELRSPHLVAVEDLIVDGDQVGIVMELVTGGTLRRFADGRGPLAAPAALGLVRQILLGLDVVHAHGVVHRDVKPENVLLETTANPEEPIAKVSDFGIARLIDGPRLTGTSSYIGTAHYCPPEIPEGRIPTPAADIYATGVVLYQLLTGSTPFAGLTPYALILKQTQQPPPRSPLIADAVWTVLERWLKADPAARPPDARQALLEVDGLLKLLRPPATAWGGTGYVPSQDYLEVVHNATPTEPIPWAPFTLESENPGTGAGVGVGEGHIRPARRPNALLLVAGAVVVVGIAAGAPALLSSSGSSTVAATTPATRLSLFFPTEEFPESGVTLTRTWTLERGKHPMLHGVLVFRTSKANAAEVDEVLPKSLAANVSAVTFTPQPKVIQADPIVRYSLPPVAGVTVTDKYDIPVSSNDLSLTALQRWAAQQSAEAGLRYRTAHQLASLVLVPDSVEIPAGATVQLRLAGKQEDGTVAATVAFGGASYSVDQPSIAAVSRNGLLRAFSAGRTTVHARIGALTAREIITVTAGALAPGVSRSAVPNSSGASTSGGPTTAPARNSVPPATVAVPSIVAPTTLAPTLVPPVTVPPTSDVPTVAPTVPATDLPSTVPPSLAAVSFDRLRPGDLLSG